MNAIDTAMNYSNNIEVDLESNLFKINRKSSLLKPKQCGCCLLLFTPKDEDDNFCSTCKEEGFMAEDVKLHECETLGCTNTVKGKKRFCDACQDKKQKQRGKDYYNDIRPKPPVKKEILTIDSPFEKLIKGIFFTFENEVESVLFNLKDGSKFLIGGING